MKFFFGGERDRQERQNIIERCKTFQFPSLEKNQKFLIRQFLCHGSQRPPLTIPRAAPTKVDDASEANIESSEKGSAVNRNRKSRNVTLGKLTREK